MDVVVERAVDRATASSASCPRSIPSRSRARPGDVLARFAMSATPAASTPFCAATNPNATRNPSNPTRKLPGGHARANATRSAPISNPASNNAARLANRSQRDASIIAGCAGASIPTSSRAAQNRSKTRRSASTSSQVASRATKSGRDATKSGRDADTGRELERVSVFRACPCRNAARRCRAQSARVNSSSRSWTWVMFPRSRSSDASRDARKIAAALRVR